MGDVRTNLRIIVDGDGKLVSVEKHYDAIEQKSGKAQAAVTKFGAAGSFDKMQGSLSGVASKVDALSGGMTNLGGVAAKLANPWVLAGAAIAGAAVEIGRTVALGGKLADLSAKFRISGEDLQRLGNAGALSGVAMEDFAAGISKLRRNMVDAPEKFAALGIEVDKWKRLGGAELALEFARAMENVKDDSAAAAVGMELAGKGYQGMAAAMNSGDIESAMRAQVALTEEQIRKADELGDKWERVKQIVSSKTGGVKAEVANFYVEGATKMAERWDSYFGTNLATPSEAEIQAKIEQNRLNDPSVKKPDIGELYEQNKLKEEAEQQRKIKEKASAESRKREQKADQDARAQSMKDEEDALKAWGEKEEKAQEENLRIAAANDKAYEDEAVKVRADSLTSMEGHEKQTRGEIDRMAKAYLEQAEQGRKKFMSPDAWDAYNRNFDKAIDKAQRMGDLFGTLREGLLAMGVSAGSFAMKLAVALEMGSAAKSQLLASMQKNDKLGMASAGVSGLMSAYQSGSFLGGGATGAMLGSAIGKNIPGLGFLGKYGGAVVGGLIGGIAGLFGKKKEPTELQLAQEKYKDVGTGDFFGQMASKTEYATADFVKLMNAAKGTAQYTEWMSKNVDLSSSGVSKMVDAMQYLSKDGAEAVGGAFSQSFWATMQTKGLAAATETFGPIIDKVTEQVTSMGLDASVFGLDKIERLMSIGKDPKTAALLGAVGGNKDYIQGQLNSNYMTDDTLKGSGKIAKATFDELQNQGLTEKESYEQMADYLAAVQRASEASGKAIPEEIQRMIQGAKENGIEFTKQPLEKLSDYTKDIRDFLLAKTGAGSSAPQGTGSNPSTADVQYNSETGSYEGWGPRPAGYPPNDPWPPRMATGGFVPARPGGTPVILGEGGEGEYVVPASQMGAGGTTLVLDGVTVQVQTLGDIARAVEDAIVRAIDSNPRVRAEIQRAQRR